jgi:uncharacterized membrane protein HdeD (DUF308 family)
MIIATGRSHDENQATTRGGHQEADMTNPQTNRPEPGPAGGVAQDHPPGDQPAVPQQGMRPEDAQPDDDAQREAVRRDEAARQAGLQPAAGRHAAADAMAPEPAGSANGGGLGGLGASIARLAWTTALAAAIGMIAVGILLLVWPHATLTVVAILIGAALLVAGGFRLADGIMDRRGEGGGMRAADIVIGLLAILAGLYCLKHQSLTVLVLALVVGAFWIIHGVGDLVAAASQGRVPGRGLRVASGLFSVAAGVVILFWPGISLILLLTILGAWLLLYGCVLAGLALRLRRDSKPGATSRAARAAA